MLSNQKIYEGKAKILYTTNDPEILLTYFKDDATAFNAQKKGKIIGKGKINCTISSYIFQILKANNIPTHFIDCPQSDQMRVRRVKILPIEVIVRNIAAGSLCRQTGLTEGTILKFPLVEYCYKNDDLQDPLLTRDRLLLLELATPEQLDQIRTLTLKINDLLTNLFNQCQITLVDFKIEFGLDKDENLILADEISPDSCRLWDLSQADPNQRVMDKDRFRRDLGNVENAYQQVLERILAHQGSNTP
ncbi:phosphoribosylaminoimidazolesuccinocarboxamide synthase [Okeania sp.]|uniref:phosphoribosylaminoimidazolesuccinocarboxamide synthase n=1 Tax=Okeania sp. TaxID=3100323 RepID=UPI002B4AEA02|nr:phosphoribosylaminoimidazolesuccinocarboxamide synthase [Okeania sp.]MEB3341701.1 phosphoribosylaminoimidazolesuccinocarboxamide synthase [Okeania sp.]